LLEHHLKALRLPTILREYDKVAQQCAAEDVELSALSLRLTEQELLDRDAVPRTPRSTSEVPGAQESDSFDFLAIPIVEQGHGAGVGSGRSLLRARGKRASVGTARHRKNHHIALALGLALARRVIVCALPPPRPWCMKLIEAKDEKAVLAIKQMAAYDSWIVDENGLRAALEAGAELLFESSASATSEVTTMVTSNLRSRNGPRSLGFER